MDRNRVIGLTMQSCGIYLLKNTVFVISYSSEANGPLLPVGPMFKIESTEPCEIGEAVVAALDASSADAPRGPDAPRAERALIKFLGVKRWSDVIRTMTYAMAERQSDAITALGHRVGQYAGLVRDGTSFRSSSRNAEDVGRVVLRALKVPDDQ
jgi:hypothetical protein